MRRLIVRSAALAGYAELARTLGLDPARLARMVGLSLAVLANPDNEIGAGPAYRLLEISAAASGALDFGLRLARRRRLSDLGALGMLVRDEPDVRAAIRRMISSMNLHGTCVALDLQEAGGVAMIRVTVHPDGEASVRQATEAAVGMLVQLLRGMLGAGWSPAAVQFVHAAIAGTDRPHRQLFGCSVSFSTDRNAVTMPSAALDRPVPLSDPAFRAYAGLDLHNLIPVGGRAGEERVRQAMLPLLPLGRCTAAGVARKLGVDRRTLHRHLGTLDLNFSKVLNALRAELAQQYLAAGLLSLTDIAQLLGFNSLSAFSRWFAGHAGSPPSRWRRYHAGAPQT